MFMGLVKSNKDIILDANVIKIFQTKIDINVIKILILCQLYDCQYKIGT